MSAYPDQPDQDPILVSPAHIDRLVHLALSGPLEAAGKAWRPLSWLVLTPHRYVDSHRWNGTRHASEITANTIGQLLLQENYASVYAVEEAKAHQAHVPIPLPPGQIPEAVERYQYQTPAETLSAGEALSALEYYETNASASRYWESSEAHNFCTELRFALCHAIARATPTSWDLPAAGRSL